MTTYAAALADLQTKLGAKEGLIALASIAQPHTSISTPQPAARLVSSYYENGAFYFTTHATTAKILQITENPAVALCVIVESFTADGVAENLGWVCAPENAAIMAKLRVAFADWYADANDDNDPDTCVVRIKLTKGRWNFPHEGRQQYIDFLQERVY